MTKDEEDEELEKWLHSVSEAEEMGEPEIDVFIKKFRVKNKKGKEVRQ
jgi:hypothetical protein